MLASSPASILNQTAPDLGIPFRFNPNESGSRPLEALTRLCPAGRVLKDDGPGDAARESTASVAVLRPAHSDDRQAVRGRLALTRSA